jgi:agmatinase
MQRTAIAYIRDGQTPFFRLPSQTEGLAADAVVLGVPYDGGVTYQPGARMAPFSVRRLSAVLESFHPHHGIDVFASLRTVDGGNIVFPPFDAAAVREAIQAEVSRLVGAGATPFLVGGDHSIALPALRAVAAEHGPVALVHVDAHSDTSGDRVWGESFHHGAPIRHALEEGLIERGQLYQVGLRATWGSSADGDYVRSKGGQVFTMGTVCERGIGPIAGDIARRIGDRPTYISFDVDAIDPAHAPGTGTPVPGGMSSREALSLLRGLAGVALVGMDVVEIAPSLDHAEITSLLGAHLVYEGLALAALAVRRRR